MLQIFHFRIRSKHKTINSEKKEGGNAANCSSQFAICHSKPSLFSECSSSVRRDRFKFFFKFFRGCGGFVQQRQGSQRWIRARNGPEPGVLYRAFRWGRGFQQRSDYPEGNGLYNLAAWTVGCQCTWK